MKYVIAICAIFCISVACTSTWVWVTGGEGNYIRVESSTDSVKADYGLIDYIKNDNSIDTLVIEPIDTVVVKNRVE